MKGVWAVDHTQPNVSLVFTLDMGAVYTGMIRIAAASCYKLIADGTMIAFGPSRAAHGYARIDEYQINARTIAVEVAGYEINSFWLIKQPSFFLSEVLCGEHKFTHDDFTCRLLTDRVRRVQRYSYQRCFSEVYDMSADRGDYSMFPIINTMPAGDVKPLSCDTLAPKLNLHVPNMLYRGGVCMQTDAMPWRDRAHTHVGAELEGYTVEEWQESATDDLSRMKFDEDGSGRYHLYDFGGAMTGFLELEVETHVACTLYASFDEVLWNEEGKGDYNVSFYRAECSNAIKWTLRGAGVYRLAAFEPYTMRYLRLTAFGDDCESLLSQVKVRLRDYRNPEADRLRFAVDDADVTAILEAARESFAQNAVDLLTDCPSRERAGWLSDSLFTSVAERLFTGHNRVERAFLQNYALADTSRLPDGMLPMCYPADLYDSELYIPNWAMWYVYEIVKYAEHYGIDDTVRAARSRVEGVVSYFAAKTNEFGLIENLEGWIFVEWSAANDADRVCGINVPSNMCWAACLIGAGKLYGRSDWTESGARARTAIRELAFDGTFFVDNLVRNADGNVVATAHYSEVCQYYAFWFDTADKLTYAALYDELMNRLGVCRADGYRPEVVAPNAMYGVYMRLDLLMRDGDRRRLYSECKAYFLKMAHRTGTLWENNFVHGSCVHGFASYAAKWLVWALTGYDAATGKVTAEDGIGINCTFDIPCGEDTLHLVR